MVKIMNSFVKKYGGLIACCAFAFVAFGSHIPCVWPFYEPKVPEALINSDNERFFKGYL